MLKDVALAGLLIYYQYQLYNQVYTIDTHDGIDDIFEKRKILSSCKKWFQFFIGMSKSSDFRYIRFDFDKTVITLTLE